MFPFFCAHYLCNGFAENRGDEPGSQADRPGSFREPEIVFWLSYVQFKVLSLLCFSAHSMFATVLQRVAETGRVHRLIARLSRAGYIRASSWLRTSVSCAYYVCSSFADKSRRRAEFTG